MTTISDLVTSASSMLHSFTGIKEQFTYLSTAIDTDDTTLTVGHSNRITIGIIEVDDELMLVDDASGTDVQLLPFGRGYMNTTAVAHAVNAPVTNDPMFPRSAIMRKIGETVDQVHPDLFQVKTTEFTFSPAVFSYELPEDCDRVLEVKFDVPGPVKVWPRARRWRFDRSSGEFDTGKGLELYEAVTPGYTVRVTYAGPFGDVTAGTQTLADLGVPESARDVLEFGACWRLIQTMEVSRLQLQAAEQAQRAQSVSSADIQKLSQYFYATFQQRLTEERRRLLTLNPMEVHYVR